jgi:hypothetical protein
MEEALRDLLSPVVILGGVLLGLAWLLPGLWLRRKNKEQQAVAYLVAWGLIVVLALLLTDIVLGPVLVWALVAMFMTHLVVSSGRERIKVLLVPLLIVGGMAVGFLAAWVFLRME